MASCCVADCFNRPSRKSHLQFHRIPSGTRPSQVHRRKLWLHALQPWIRQAKPSSTRLNGGARVCGAHFISGEMSLDHNNVDFIPSVFQGIKHPSVFQCIKKGRKKRITRFMPKKRHRHKKEAGEEEMKTPPEADPVDEQSPVLMETESELSQELEAPSPPSVAKEAETLTEMAEAEKGVGTITSQTTSSPNKTSPLVPAVRNPVVVLQPLILQAGGYEFQLCSRSLATAAQPVEEEQSDEEETPSSCGTCGKQFTSQTGLTQHQCVKPEEPSFPCNMCDRSFTSNHCLKRHKLLHVKDGRKCGKCGVLFCRRHNHTPFRPATDFKEASSGDELQTEESNVKPKKGVQSDQSWKPGAMTVKPWRRNATNVPKPPPTINTVPTPPSPTTTVPTAPPTINTVPTPPSPTTTVPTPPPTINTVPTPPPPTINTVPTPLPTNTTVPIPSHSTTTVLTAPITATTTVPTPSHSTTTVPTPPPTTTTVPSPSHGTTTVPRGPTITFTTITTTTTTTSTVPTPPNPQPLSETHKFQPPSPEKRVQAKTNPAPSSASRPPPPVPGGSRNLYTSAAAVPPPTLPSSLKLFSPQYLTSALLQVTRNYEYILSKSKGDVKVGKVIKEEPSERPISPVEEIVEQIVEPVPKGRIAYDLEIVV